MGFQLTSDAFEDGREIPKSYTCQGENISPALLWVNPPEDTKSFVLIVDDPDAPDPRAPKMTFVHWVLYNIPQTSSTLFKDEAKNGVPNGSMPGLNDYKKIGYKGPCPPIGRHRYFFKLYALDIVLDDLNQPTKSELLPAMEGHILQEAVLMGTYQNYK